MASGVGPGISTCNGRLELLSKTRARVTLVAILAVAGFIGSATAVYQLNRTTTHVGALTVVTVAYEFTGTTDEISEAQGEQAALKKVHELRPDVTGVAVSHTQRTKGLYSVADSNGNRIFSSSQPIDAWVFELHGPPQLGFKTVTGASVINATTGEVEMVSVLLSN
jgi:hypothetical protein